MNINLSCLYISIRRLQCSTVHSAVSSEARVLGKIMRGSRKVKKSKFVPENNRPVIPELLGETAKGNAKVGNRRISVLNSLFLERITDLMSSELDRTLLDHGFAITKVNYVLNGSALNVYWTSESGMIVIQERMFDIAKRLRHELTQLHCGRVPHINFIKDHNMFKATDVEDLLKIADYGEDDSNSENSSDLPPVVEEQQPFVNLVKSSDVLGINREAIMNQVLQSMNQKPKATQKPAQSMAETFQREIDFKKYLHLMKISQAKRNEERKRSQADLTTLTSLYASEQPNDDTEDGFYEDDYNGVYDSFQQEKIEK